MSSIWWERADLPAFEPLRGGAKTHALIIGGGMAGLLCAYFLQRAGVDYLLVEAESICSGITKNTTAKITSQHGLVYDKLVKGMGLARARLYLTANQRAVAQYKELCQGLDCGFAERDAYVYSLRGRKRIENELKALHRLGFQADYARDLPLPFPTDGAVRFQNQAQFDPLAFAGAIARGLNIHERTKVLELGEGWAKTSGGVIRAEKILVATHFPILNKHGSYYMKLYQHRSYVLALEGGPQLPGMYVDEAKKGMSFRNHGALLLVGGGDHRTGKRGGGWAELRAFAKRHYPGATERYHWATQDCMSLDGAPYIGPYSKKAKGLYVATGFNKWGMTSSMVAAMLLSDMAQGKENPFAPAFDPSRGMLTPQLFLNGLESAASLLAPTKPRCPHMGCALKWNPAERTWDCPCHGSRFSEKGDLIDNPATDGL